MAAKATVADIFRHSGREFIASYGATLNRAARRVLAAIRNCRTAALGARHYQCPHCDIPHVLYNSCRNRHCPQCQGTAAHQWLEKQSARVLPAPYFHIVFTLPTKIATVAYANRKVVFDILMRTSAKTLTVIAADPKHLGVQVGGTCVLHSWDQKLLWHPHVHALVTAAGFDVITGRWKTTNPKFFAPVKVLARYFRNRCLDELHQAYCQGLLIFPGSIAHLKSKTAFEALVQHARQQDWNVYAKPPCQGPKALIRYLSRYTHRVAIGNSRILAFDGKTVTFRYRKPVSQAHSKPQYGTLKLTVAEFLRRYLMHVLPKRFHRIRHFGILANAKYKQTLQQVQVQTGWLSQPAAHDHAAEDTSPKCPTCSTPMTLVAIETQHELRIVQALARAPPGSKAA